MVTSVRNCLVKMVLRLFQALSVVMTIVPTLLRQFRRSLQIKKIIRDAHRVLKFTEQPKYINQQQRKRVGYQDTSDVAKKLQKLHSKKAHGRFYPQWKRDSNLDRVSYKTKSTKSKATFLRQNIFFEFQVADHQMSTRTQELYANLLKQLFVQLHV